MANPTIWFLSLMLVCVVVQGIFALFEMACVSMNKMRLHYFVSLQNQRAVWVSHLLDRPSRLFGTVLIGITASLQIGSECARRFYLSIGWDPDWAPVSQAILVVLFGELVPLFTARRHPQRIAFALIPLMTLISWVLTPVIWVFDGIAIFINRLFMGSKTQASFLSREEVQRSFEMQNQSQKEISELMTRLFRCKNLLARELMTPIASIPAISLETKGDAVKEKLLHQHQSYIPVYQHDKQNVVGIVFQMDLLNKDLSLEAKELMQSCWYLTMDTPVLDMIDQYRKNNRSVSVIIDQTGQTRGVLSMEQIEDVLFGPEYTLSPYFDREGLYVKRTIPGKMRMNQFNREFRTNVLFQKKKTLSDWIVQQLGHLPIKGETLQLEQYELTIVEPSFRGVKSVSIQTIE